MKRFIEGIDRSQGLLFPDHLEDFIGEDNPVRAVDVFVDALDLLGVGFAEALCLRLSQSYPFKSPAGIGGWP